MRIFYFFIYLKFKNLNFFNHLGPDYAHAEARMIIFYEIIFKLIKLFFIHLQESPRPWMVLLNAMLMVKKNDIK
jgi:hypothetical protein